MSSELKTITRITQSPMNKQQYLLELDCGHEEWVTAKRWPTRTKLCCSTCAAMEVDHE